MEGPPAGKRAPKKNDRNFDWYQKLGTQRSRLSYFLALVPPTRSSNGRLKFDPLELPPRSRFMGTRIGPSRFSFFSSLFRALLVHKTQDFRQYAILLFLSIPRPKVHAFTRPIDLKSHAHWCYIALHFKLLQPSSSSGMLFLQQAPLPEHAFFTDCVE